MKAVTWCGKYDVRVSNVPDPKILNPRDAIIKVTSTCICGSDLHLYDGYIPGMQAGDIIGHEFMGEVVELGHGVNKDKLKIGDRIVVPFTICCGSCFFCHNNLWSCCENTNPNAVVPEQVYGSTTAGLFGYSHLTGGYAGGQAEYVRVPYADVAPMKVPEGLTDDQVIFLTDIFPTGYMAAENCNIKPGDTVAVWGCGPVAQFAIRSALLLGAEQVVAMDDVPERLEMAAQGGATTINIHDEYVYERLRDLTGGRGPDACIDAVGMEAHGLTVDAFVDKAKAALYLGTDRTHALRQAINCCRAGGTVSVPGVYGGMMDKFPIGAFMQKGLTMKTGQTHVPAYLDRLMGHIQRGDIDPSFVVTHRLPLDQAPHAYEIFQKKADNCIKVVLKP
ncbi:MAG TPA: zinc-dependent alcohol dehydrogenase [Tepidisphaeraceae bacterium]|jgi:threonine dehydrogenase-like Zn-dependent dehydrogenase|nr:zinc-dependent alcohol dehydrogenase [Tepidisphaeraceae bacterium]